MIWAFAIQPDARCNLLVFLVGVMKPEKRLCRFMNGYATGAESGGSNRRYEPKNNLRAHGSLCLSSRIESLHTWQLNASSRPAIEDTLDTPMTRNEEVYTESHRSSADISPETDGCAQEILEHRDHNRRAR